MKRILLFLVMTISNNVYAYETQTHDLLSKNIIEKSILDLDPELLNSWGLEFALGTLTEAFPSYVPKDPSDPNESVLNINASISEIIRGGSVLEDAEERSLNHFYDPQHGGKALEVGIYRAKYSSKIWSNEGQDNILQIIPEQEYSYRDAIVYFYTGLTATSEDVRKVYFGKMFRSLGHVIHHLQDMAQPQHVRNDNHCDPDNDWRCNIYPNPSHYEKYTDRRRNFLPFTISEGMVPTIPFFSMASEYWDNAAGSGLAEFTSTNFVSQGTNFLLVLPDNPLPYPGYPLPALISGAFNVNENLETLLEEDGMTAEERTEVMNNLDCAAATRLCEIEFIPTLVTDNNLSPPNNTALNKRASSISLLDDELKKRGLFVNDSDRLATLNRFNFISAYNFLIPRAVAYGAGLINHFYRGRLQIEKADNDGNQLTVRVKNVSKPDQTLSGDSFELYYDATDGSRKRIDSLTVTSGSLILAVGESSQLTADLPGDVDTSKEKPYILVFNAYNHGGLIGKDNGIAAINFTVEKVSGFLVTPQFTPTDGITGQRLVTKRNGKWVAIPAPDLVAGNVDWKGRYVNGKPTKVLTWLGEPSRYFPIGSTERSSDIYQGGHVYSRMPCLVLGAAIQKDNEGKEWIIGICSSFSTIRVMKRPNTLSLSTAMYSPDTELDGWRELDSFSLEPEIYTSWFFNGNGTEAQSVMHFPTGEPRPNQFTAKRMKISLAGGKTLLTVEENDYPVVHHTTVCAQSSNNFHESIIERAKFPLAVDYMDTQEVIAYFESDFQLREDWQEDENGVSNATVVYLGGRHLNIGTEKINLSNYDGSKIIFDRVSGMNYEYLGNTINNDIFILDLRSQFSTYMQNESKVTGLGSVTSGRYVETWDYEFRRHAVIDQKSSINKSQLIEEHNENWTLYDSVSTNKIPNTCGFRYDRHSNTESTESNELAYYYGYIQPNREVIDYYFIYAVKGVDEDLALNLNISYNVFASTEHRNFHMDELSGGELNTLIPGGGEEPRYNIYLIK